MIPFLTPTARFARNLRAAAGAIHISPSEKARVQRELLAFMEKNPFPQEYVASGGIRAQRAFFLLPALHAPALRPAPLVATLLITITILSTGSAAAFVAQESLPGDLLYPVKINVNERIEIALARGAEAQGEVAARQTERRLREANSLVSQGRLTQELNEKIEAHLDRNVAMLERVIVSLNEKENYETASRLQTVLEGRVEAHAEILARLQVAGTHQNNESVERLRTYVQENQDGIKERLEATAERVRDSEESVRLRVTLAAQTNASQSIESALARLKRSEYTISSRSYTQARALITEAQESYAKGQRHLESNSYAEASSSFYEATRLANRALVVINTSIRIEWDAPAQDSEQNDEQKTTEVKSESEAKVEQNSTQPETSTQTWLRDLLSSPLR